MKLLNIQTAAVEKVIEGLREFQESIYTPGIYECDPEQMVAVEKMIEGFQESIYM